MFKSIKTGGTLIVESIKIFIHLPILLVPLLFCWIVYAPTILYLKYFLDWESLSFSSSLLIAIGVIFLFAFILAFSCMVMLEIVQQLESGETANISKALHQSITHNLLNMMPIVLVWTFIWFILFIIQALLSKDKRKEESSLTAENAAKTLAGYQSFTLSRAFFDAVQKGVRMIVFLILPAIAWENHGFITATKRGIAVFKAHLSTFASGFVITGIASAIIFLPPALLFYISSKFDVSFPEYVWYVTIVYIGFAWSYTMYLEQMFIAELYLWNLKWERAVITAQSQRLPLPSLNDVPAPTLLDGTADLINSSLLIQNIPHSQGDISS